MNPFDKSTSKMIIDIIAEKVENIIIRKSLEEFARNGEFRKAAKLISDIIEDWQSKEKVLHDIREKIRNL